MKGNEIVVASNPRGMFVEGYVDGTPKPGTCMQIKAGVEPIGGRYTYEVYNKAADGARGQILVLCADQLQGKTADDAYVDGDRCFLYSPVMGEELNCLIGDVAGTGATSDFSIGDKLIVDDGTGKLVDASGSEESAPFELLETITDLAADYLAHVVYTGY